MGWAAVRSGAVVPFVVDLLFIVTPIDSVVVLCFVVRFFVPLLVLWLGGEGWLLCLVSLPGVSWLLCGSSSRCRGLVCSL